MQEELLPFGLTFISALPESASDVLEGAYLDPVTQLAYIGDVPLHEVVPMIAIGTRTNPDGKDAIAVDTDEPSD